MLFSSGHWLMCAPDHYDVTYEINPWMSVTRAPLKKRAVTQWQTLHDTILRLGGTIESVAPVAGQPDMVFTANAGLVRGKDCILAHFKFPQRTGEEVPYRAWFDTNGFNVIDLGGLFFEGEGDALFAGEKLFVGHGFRTDKAVGPKLGQLLGIRSVFSCELVDPYYYHLDTCFAPLDDKRAIYFPGAFAPETLKVLRNEIELFEVPPEDARKFACNAVVLGRDVIIPAGCPATSAIIKGLGFSPHDVELDEFIKAGGAAKCLTLRV